jgi:hypothetical protein
MGGVAKRRDDQHVSAPLHTRYRRLKGMNDRLVFLARRVATIPRAAGDAYVVLP